MSCASVVKSVLFWFFVSVLCPVTRDAWAVQGPSSANGFAHNTTVPLAGQNFTDVVDAISSSLRNSETVDGYYVRGMVVASASLAQDCFRTGTEAALQEGDLIISINGQSPAEFSNAINSPDEDNLDWIEVKYLRDMETRVVSYASY